MDVWGSNWLIFYALTDFTVQVPADILPAMAMATHRLPMEGARAVSSSDGTLLRAPLSAKNQKHIIAWMSN